MKEMYFLKKKKIVTGVGIPLKYLI